MAARRLPRLPTDGPRGGLCVRVRPAVRSRAPAGPARPRRGGGRQGVRPVEQLAHGAGRRPSDPAVGVALLRRRGAPVSAVRDRRLEGGGFRRESRRACPGVPSALKVGGAVRAGTPRFRGAPARGPGSGRGVPVGAPGAFSVRRRRKKPSRGAPGRRRRTPPPAGGSRARGARPARTTLRGRPGTPGWEQGSASGLRGAASSKAGVGCGKSAERRGRKPCFGSFERVRT